MGTLLYILSLKFSLPGCLYHVPNRAVYTCDLCSQQYNIIHVIEIEWELDSAASAKLEQGCMYNVRMSLFSLQALPTHDLITLSMPVVLPD